jgi:molybdopterin-binding protein
MALGIGYGLPFVAQHGTNPYKTQWAAALEGAKGAGATVEDENAGTGSCLVARGQEAYTDGLPSTPSLLIVPQFYKAGNLYQDVPPFVAEDSTMRFTVSRNTTATRVNSSGLIESIASGVPRIDWLGQSCPALLVEASATNFARWVNQMTAQDTPTASGGMTITTGSTDFLAPDGTSGSITKYVGGAASGTTQYAYYTGGGIVATASGAHTFSLFVKRGATNPLNFCALQFENYVGASGTTTSYFNLASGTALTAGASIVDYGNGWYRLISAPLTLAAGDLNGQLIFWMAEGNNDLSWPASGALNLTAYTWGAQLETGSIATTYIPTTSGTGSRAADVISASGALVSGLIGQTEGTMYAEVDVRNWTASGRVLAISDGTSDARVVIQVGANRTLQAVVTAASGEVANIATASGQVNGIYKCAVAYASGDFAFYVNANQIGTDSSGAVPACNNVALGKIETSASTNFLNDRIRAAALYTTRLTDAQLAELTRL